jgi:hypothetical protein
MNCFKTWFFRQQKYLKPILFILFFLFFKISQAADHYRKGYIITVTGDTIRGFINDGFGSTNPTSIYFKKTPTTEAEEYNPAKVIYFFMEAGERLYFGTSVRFLTKDLSHPAKFEGYLRIIASGSLTLYKLRINGAILFFVADETNELIQLLNRNGQENFHNQLKKMTRQCVNIQTDVNKVKLSEHSLSDFIIKYNVCGKRPQPLFSIEGGVLGGITNGELRISSSEPDIANGDLSRNWVTAGGYFLAKIDRGGRKIGFYSELQYKHFADGYNTRYTSGTYTYNCKNDVSQSFIKLYGGIHYAFSSKKIKPFFQFGLVTSARVGGYFHSKCTSLSGVSIKESNHDKLKDKGAYLGFGIDLWALEIEYRVDINKTYEYENYKAKWTNNYFLIKYCLFKARRSRKHS